MAEMEKVDLGLPENGDEMVTGKKKTSILELIKEKIRGARQYLYDTFVDVDKSHPIFNKMNKAETALSKLDDIEAISAANLQALYDISCTFETAIKSNSLEEAGKLLEKMEQLAAKIQARVLAGTREDLPTFKGMLETALSRELGDKFDPNVHYEDNMKVFTAEDGRVFVGLANEEGTKLEPVFEAIYVKGENGKKDTIEFKQMKDYSVEMNPEKTSVPLLRNNTIKGEGYLKLTEYEMTIINPRMPALGKLQLSVLDAVAAKEGGKAYEQALYLSDNPALKLLEPYANNTVRDDNGLEASFLPYDGTFRIYNPDTKELTVFEKNDQGGFTGMLYNNVDSLDAQLYMPKESSDTIDLNAVEFDKTKPMYKGIPIMEARTVKRNGKEIAETHTSIPLGNTSLYYTLQSDAAKSFLLSQGLDEFNVKQIMDIGKDDGIVFDKVKAIKGTAQLAETASLWEGYVKQTLDAEYAADSKEINSLAAKYVTKRGGSAITLETPEGGEFRLSLNGKGNAVTLDYKEPDGNAFQPVYDPIRGIPKISAKEFRVLSAKDKTFQSVLAASAYTLKEKLTGEVTKVEKKEHSAEHNKARKEIERD